MRSLFAFLVAINQYDQPEINDLAGCLNDLEGMKQSLESYCNACQKLRLHEKVLTNKEATRQAVINGFTFFNQARDGDVCLFYFSGHGAQLDMPPEFWDEADQMLEAIVCYVAQGNDNLLIDKELSFLIAETQRDKDLHFVVITDCCYSGSNTKGDLFSVRTVKPNLNVRKVDEYLGRASYDPMVNGENRLQLSPPQGKHIKLAACTSSELAKEKRLGEDGKIRGVFTFSMLQVLKENGYNLSYWSLISKIKMKAQLLATDQSPQIEVIGFHPSKCNSLFLDGLLEGQHAAFKVSFEELRGHSNQIEQQWIINAGHFYGLAVGDIAILENDQKVTISAVYGVYSVLDLQSLRLDPFRTYTARVRPRSRKLLNVGFSGDSDQVAIKILNTVFQQKKSFPFIKFFPDRGIDYLIHATNGELALTHPDGNTPVFARIHGYDESAATNFLTIVDQIAEWHHIVSINNPEPTICDDEIQIDLVRVKKPHAFGNPDSAPTIPIENWQEENVFCYIFDSEHPAGPWHRPAFQLSISNQSKDKKLWVNALYCGSGYDDSAGPPYPSTVFSVENRFLDNEQLAPGKTKYMIDKVNSFIIGQTNSYKSIELSVLDDYFDHGYNEIKDLIKIFVSTEEIDTTPLTGKGVLLDVEMSSKFSRAGNDLTARFDWRTFEVPITIVRPRDLGVININQNKSFYGLTIVGHPTFSARVILSTAEELIRSTQLMNPHKYMPHPEIAFGNDNVTLIQLTTGLGAIQGVSVIEFYRTEGTNFISEKQPLIIQVSEEIIVLTKIYKLMLVGYSSVQRAYYTLGVMDSHREIIIPRLPPNSPSLIEGLGDSIKLFLMRARHDFDIAAYK